MSKNTGAIGRGVTVLKACAGRQDGVSFTELRNVCGGWPSMTLTRVLKPLVAEGMLKKDLATGLYHMGDEFCSMARAALGAQSRGELVQPIVDALARDTSHSAAYFDWDGDWLAVGAKAEVGNSYHYVPVGQRNHDLVNTFFQVCAANLPGGTVRKIRQKCRNRGTQDVISDDELAEIKEDGIRINRDPFHGACIRFAAPVFVGTNGPLAGAIGISSLALDLSEDQQAQYEALVRQAAARATHALGIR